MYRHILIPTDGSQTAEKAVDAGTTYAREAGARVLFFTAVPEYAMPRESEMMARHHVTSIFEYEEQAAAKARAILDNLMRFVLPAVAGEVKLLPLEALAKKDLSVVALRAAARRGVLRARRHANGDWLSTKNWVNDYQAARWGRLRQPRKPVALEAK